MKKMQALFFVVFSVLVVIGLTFAWAQEKNLSANKEVTAKIRAFDQEFFQGFDVYSAGVKGAPTALLFKIKNNTYLRPTRFWGAPLGGAEIIQAIKSLDDQYNDIGYKIPFLPRALNIINVKGELVGYVYTGLGSVQMDRKKDGSVTVYPPNPPMLRR